MQRTSKRIFELGRSSYSVRAILSLSLSHSIPIFSLKISLFLSLAFPFAYAVTTDGDACNFYLNEHFALRKRRKRGTTGRFLTWREMGSCTLMFPSRSYVSLSVYKGGILLSSSSSCFFIFSFAPLSCFVFSVPSLFRFISFRLFYRSLFFCFSAALVATSRYLPPFRHERFCE